MATQRFVFFEMRSRKRAARISYISSSAVEIVRKIRVPLVNASQRFFSKIGLCQKKSWPGANSEKWSSDALSVESRVITGEGLHQEVPVVRRVPHICLPRARGR